MLLTFFSRAIEQGIPVMADYNMERFASGFFTQDADLRTLVAYDSRATESQTQQQGSLARAMAQVWALPLRSDGTPPLCGLFGGTGLNSSLLYKYAGTHGWTAAGVVPGGTYQNSGGNTNCGFATTDLYVAVGSGRTAYSDGTSANGNVGSWLPGIHTETGTYPGVDVWGGNPFMGRECSARYVYLGAGSAGPTDMALRAIRSVDFWTSINTLTRTAYVGADVPITLDGSGVGYQDVSCGSGPGLPGVVLRNPSGSTTGSGPLRIFHQGVRIFRSSGGVPIQGWHLGAYGTGGHTIGQALACIGQSGYSGLSPDPYFTSANASALYQAGWGRTSGANGPNKVICYTGANFASDEQTELAAGTTTTYRDRHIAWIDAITSLCSALNGGAEPDICIVFTEAIRNTFSGRMYTTALKAVIEAAAARRQSVCDLFTRTNTKDTSLSTPWADPFEPPFQKGNVYQNTNTASGGPVKLSGGNIDFVHHSRVGDQIIAMMIWQSMAASLGISDSFNVAYPAATIGDNPRNRFTRSEQRGF